MSSGDAFQITALVIGALPFGAAIEALLRVISQQYQASQDVKVLLGELPERVGHFGRKIAEVKSSIAEDSSWLSKIVREFEAELRTVEKTVSAYKKSFWTMSRDKTKMQACEARLVRINSNLDDAINVHNHSLHARNAGALTSLRDSLVMADRWYRTHCCRHHQDTAAPHDALRQDPNDAKLMNEAVELADLLMAEVDQDGDGHLTVDELWGNVNIRRLISNREVLQSLVTNLFDKDGNGDLDYRETLGLAAALQQINKLFSSIPIRCQDDSDYVPSAEIIVQLKLRGYTSITQQDMDDVADAECRWFRWDLQGGSSCSYEGFLHVYFHVVNKYDLWGHAKKRIGGR